MNHEALRTRRVLYGAASLGIANVITNVIWLVIIGLASRYFLPEEFGLWSILISLSGMFLTGVDLGFGNALRNRLTQFNSRQDSPEASSQVYFLSVFYWLLFLAGILTILFVIARPFIPWSSLINASKVELVSQAAWLFTVGASLSVFNTACSLYMPGFFSYQQSHWNALLGALSKAMLLVSMWVMILFRSSFGVISITFFVVTLAASAGSLATFMVVRKWGFIAVSLTTVLEKVKELWRKSAQFAFLQIFATVLLYADLFVISHILGLASVGDYFLVKRIYLLISTFQFTLLLPVWSAYTESVELKDHDWTASTLRRTAVYVVVISVAGAAMVSLLGNFMLRLWTGREVSLTLLLVLMGIWSIVYSWNNCFSVFLNAVGNLKMQVVLIGLSMAVFIPLATVMGRSYGLPGICVALILVHLPLAVSNPIQSVRMLRTLKSNAMEDR